MFKAKHFINGNFNNLICNLNIFYQNIQWFRSKQDLVKLTSPVINSYDVVIISEIWFIPDIHYLELGLTNFLMFKLDRNSATSNFVRIGEVLITIKSNLNSSHFILNACNVIKSLLLQLSHQDNLFLAQCTYLLTVLFSLKNMNHIFLQLKK